MSDNEARARELATETPDWVSVYSVDEMQAFFRGRLPIIRNAAKACGYAIGVHGSERRDFDLIAVPWVEKHSTPDELATAIMLATCGMTMAAYRWEQKPAGRIAVSLPICWPEWQSGALSLGMIDLSVVDLQAAESRGRAAGLREAAVIAGTMAERPYDNEPEFSAVLAVEAAIDARLTALEADTRGNGTR
jgi:hypothetical protein